jgi:hypothetical protein
MGLRERLKGAIQSIAERFSGEYSAGAAAIRPDDPAAATTDGGDVKVTRARLRRPREQAENKES